MSATELSPSGLRVCPSAGPQSASVVLVGESPAAEEMKQGIPLVGPSGQMLNKALVAAGIDRSQCYVMNLVPVRAPGDKFANHADEDLAWGQARFREEVGRLTQPRVFVALGANPTEWLCGGKLPVAQRGDKERSGFIGAWRGSIIDTDKGLNAPEDYLGLLNVIRRPTPIVPTFHPAAILRQFNWHPWFLLDIKRAGQVAREGVPKRVYRRWYRNDVQALVRLAESDINLIAVDSELDPWIVGLATDEEVHVFEWDERYRKPLSKLMASPRILKVAHRWLHDFAFFRKCLEIDVEWPIFDSVGGAYSLNTALQKELSPHISTQFTNWPYHKWLTNVDQLLYCGMDAVVCYDSYWPMMQQLCQRGFVVPASLDGHQGILDHDHHLLQPLLQMQAKGFKIDEGERLKVQGELESKLQGEVAKLTELVEPVIERNIKRFKKPHLFRVPRKCDCCGGGATQRAHCFRCHTYNCDCFYHEEKTSKDEAMVHQFKTIKAFKESWPPCETCGATGKVIKKLEFNSDSPDQLADVVYRGLHIRPRKYKGAETVKAAQLSPLADKHPIIAQIVEVSNVRSDYDTVHRLHAGVDGLLHCEFDPWGTSSGRTASKEGLLEAGTNAQNLPKEARRFVVPRDGWSFIYPDMAQIEARAYAVLSGDKNLRRALYEVLPDLGKPDYHTWLLRAIAAYDSRISLSRDQSKRTSYAGMFGVRPIQLAKELTAEAFRKGEGMPVDEKMAATILEVLYRVCPDIKRAQQAMCDEVLRFKRLKNPYTGREFTWTGFVVDKKDHGELDYEIKKQVFSRQVQDMAAFVTGLGLISIYRSSDWGSILQPLIHVHDALLIEVPKDRVTEAQALALKHMTRYIWGMDFPAEVSKKGNGENWYVVS